MNLSRWSYFGYYFKYSLLKNLIDEYQKKFNIKVESAYIYIDLQNALRTQFYDDAINDAYQGAINKERSMPIVYDTIHFLSRTKMWFESIGISPVFVIYWDEGKSIFHNNIDKNYKASRAQTSTVLPMEVFKTGCNAMKFQKKVLTELCKELKGVYCVKLKDMESDMVPHCILRCYPDLLTNPKNMNFLVSNDKDLLQTVLMGTNVFQYFKCNTNNYVYVTRKMVLEHLLKKEVTEESQNYWFNPIFTLGGDGGDDVPSVFPKVRYLTVYKWITDLMLHNNNIFEIMDSVRKGEQIKTISLNGLSASSIKLAHLFNTDQQYAQRWRDNMFLMSFDVMMDYILDRINHKSLSLTFEFKKTMLETFQTIFKKDHILKFPDLEKIMRDFHPAEYLEETCKTLCEV